MRCIALFAAGLLATTAGTALAQGTAEEPSPTYGSAGPLGEPVDVRTPGAGVAPLAAAVAFTEQDHTLINESAQINLAEITLAEMALGKEDVPERLTTAAQQVLEDHQAAQKELESMARTYDLELPEEPAPRHKEAVQMLQGLSGDEFAAEFARVQIEEHQRAIDLFEPVAKQAEAGSGTDPLAEYANKQLPILKGHLVMAQEIQQMVSPTAEAD